jgi:hypothetical protein
MLLTVLIVSVLLILIGKYGVKLLNIKPSSGKILILAGQAGLGFFLGFFVYAHGADMAEGFWTGFHDARGKH